MCGATFYAGKPVFHEKNGQSSPGSAIGDGVHFRPKTRTERNGAPTPMMQVQWMWPGAPLSSPPPALWRYRDENWTGQNQRRERCRRFPWHCIQNTVIISKTNRQNAFGPQFTQYSVPLRGQISPAADRFSSRPSAAGYRSGPGFQTTIRDRDAERSPCRRTVTSASNSSESLR